MAFVASRHGKGTTLVDSDGVGDGMRKDLGIGVTAVQAIAYANMKEDELIID